jgi:dGTPase
MYNDNHDERRFYKELHFDPSDQSEYRTEFRRDLARIIHAHGFRRLVGKTQLFPNGESDFFRNRLTHSLEVAQIAKSIALKINKDLGDSHQIDLDLVELAGLAHDLGHPPFGHQGEEVLAECMKKYGGFEGNAQTLRLLSKIEKKIIHKTALLNQGGFDKEGNDMRGGLNLTFRALASILKYDTDIGEEHDKPEHKNKIVIKGYYSSERKLVDKIKEKIAKNRQYDKFKTIECQIMDIADDIAYSSYDLEDAFKAGFMSPIDMLVQKQAFYDEISDEVNTALSRNDHADKSYKVDSDKIKDILSDLCKFMFNLPLEWIEKLNREELSGEEYTFLSNQYTTRYNQLIVQNGYTRGHFFSQLVKQSINSVYFELNEEAPPFSKVWLNTPDLVRIEILKRIAFKTQILSPKLQAQELRGKTIVREIFKFLTPNGDGDHPPELLPEDFKTIYRQSKEKSHQYRTICDYIACMTDRYAMEFYGRITSERPSSIFKPH